ncbi:MAG: 50S ribosomal protein L13 [Candidatus Saccharimonadales bacterium]
MKTYSAKPIDITRKWYVVDASEVSLGRLSTRVAVLLLGKHKPEFTSHVDCGDFVVVINAGKLVTTGNKLQTKMYYHHSGHGGGLAERSLNEQFERDPRKVVYHAVRGMLPTNKLRDGRLERLKIYADAEHHHEAQKPEKLTLGNNK